VVGATVRVVRHLDLAEEPLPPVLRITLRVRITDARKYELRD
jgi:hypothetical protein